MDKQFIVNLQGREHVLYSGLLNEAHERGLQSIETELVQIPTEENGSTAIVRAIVTLKDGTQFADYGDANPRNTNARIATALLRMASTRAKGRALRDAINVGAAMAEELPGDEEHAAPVTPHQRAREPQKAAAQERVAGAEEHIARAAGAKGGSTVAPGFEAEYVEAGVKYKREALLAGVAGLLHTAQTLALVHEMTEPEKETNADLLAWGKDMKQRIHDARDWEKGGKKDEEAGVGR